MRLAILAGAALALMAIGAIAGYYIRSPKTVTEYRDRVVTKRVVERQTTTAPDGSVVERITERETKDSKQDVPVTSPQIRERDYAIGAQWRDGEVPSVAEFGYRLMGGLWAEGRYDWRRREPSLGMRIEW